MTKNDDWASFDDVTDIDEKAEWIVEKDLAGASVFLIHHDDFNATCGCETYPLLKTLNRRFARKIKGAKLNHSCSLFSSVKEYQIIKKTNHF